MESRYWKEFLQSTAVELKRRKAPKRLTDRRCELIERDVTLGFFIIRRLCELTRVSQKTSNFRFDVHLYPYNAKPISPVARTSIERYYDLQNGRHEIKPMNLVQNRFIHSSMFLICTDETRNWDSFFVASDREKKNEVWQISAAEVEESFRTASEDYPSYVTYKHSKKRTTTLG